MNYKLKNGFVIKLNGKGKKINNTYVEISASGYHGDDDMDDFKNLIAFYSYINKSEFDNLKEKYQKLFKDKDDFEYLRDEWRDFLTDYSEMHDQCINLDYGVIWMIDGLKYYEGNICFNIFNEE